MLLLVYLCICGITPQMSQIRYTINGWSSSHLEILLLVLGKCTTTSPLLYDFKQVYFSRMLKVLEKEVFKFWITGTLVKP